MPAALVADRAATSCPRLQAALRRIARSTDSGPDSPHVTGTTGRRPETTSPHTDIIGNNAKAHRKLAAVSLSNASSRSGGSRKGFNCVPCGDDVVLATQLSKRVVGSMAGITPEDRIYGCGESGIETVEVVPTLPDDNAAAEDEEEEATVAFEFDATGEHPTKAKD